MAGINKAKILGVLTLYNSHRPIKIKFLNKLHYTLFIIGLGTNKIRNLKHACIYVLKMYLFFFAIILLF